MTSVHDQTDARLVALTFDDSTTVRLPYLWLRDNCPSGFHPDTKERLFDQLSVPEDIRPGAVSIQDDHLVIDWRPMEQHESRIPISQLVHSVPGRKAPDAANVTPELWRGDLTRTELPTAEAAVLLEDDGALFDWLLATKRSGVGFVTGLEDDPEAGMAVARRIGFLRETNFGITFDVISKPDPNNLAYTSVALPLHTDLPNQELPPGFQFLHCLINSAEGGGSLLCDGFAAAADLRTEDQDAYTTLRDVPIPMRFHDDAYDIRRHDLVIAEDLEGNLREIRFNGHLAGSFDMAAEAAPAYYSAYRRYMAKTRSDNYVVSFRLQAGEMMVFDNRRILHGRDAFDPSTGARFLRGCYVDRGEWDSRIRVLARQNKG